MRTRLLPLLALAVVLVAAAPAGASTLVDRNARGVTLEALRTAKGVDVALLTYRTRGRVHRVLAYGAINMSAPAPEARLLRRLGLEGRRLADVPQRLPPRTRARRCST